MVPWWLLSRPIEGLDMSDLDMFWCLSGYAITDVIEQLRVGMVLGKQSNLPTLSPTEIKTLFAQRIAH